jgi:hypothetical protein
MKFLVTAMAVLGLFLAPSLSRADISIVQKNNPQPDEANVLFQGTQSGSSVVGVTNTTPSVNVNFTSLVGQTLTGLQASGQAVLEAFDGTTQVQLMGVQVDVGGTRFQDLIFNAGGTGSTAGSITITANGFAADGTTAEQVSATFDLKNGSNFATTVASNGETLSNVQFTFNPAGTGVVDAKQFRISGIAGVTPPPNPTPEPSTMLIAAVGAMGFAGYSLRRRKKS